MRNAVVLVALVVLVLGPKTQVGAQCGAPISDWGMGPTLGAAGNGDTAVFGSGRVIRVANISDPENPAVVAQLPLGGLVRGIAVSGNHAYIAASKAGLVILDISNPLYPVQVANWPTQDQTLNVTIDNGTAFVADNGAGMVILDVGVPENPVLVGAIDPGGSVWDVAINGGLAYLAKTGDGMNIVDISDPGNPELVSTLEEAGNCRGISLSDGGQWAYVPDFYDGFRVLDVSDPSSPSLVSSVELSNYVLDAHARGNHLYVANRGNGLRIFDVSNPLEPIEVRTVDRNGEATRIGAYEDQVYLANAGGGLSILDRSIPEETEELGFIAGSPSLNSPAIGGSLALLTGGRKVVILDISDPLSPVEVTTTEFPGYARAAVFDGELVYVADSTGGVDVLDLSDPRFPIHIGSVDFSAAYDVALSGDTLYVACSIEGFRVVDVSNPVEPVVIGSLETAAGRYLEYANNTVYITDYQLGVHVIDVTDPSAPTETTLIEVPEPMARPEVEGNIMYVSCSGTGIKILDISDPASTVDLGTIGNAVHVFGLSAVGHILFLTDIYEDVFIFDVSDPRAPSELATSPLATTRQGDISSQGSIVVVAEDDGGVEIFDLNPCFADPPIAGFSWTPAAPEVGQLIRFTDTSIGSIDTRTWTFGDEGKSEERNPTHIFAAPGDYQVTLEASGIFGAQAVSRRITVTPKSGDGPLIGEMTDYSYVIAASAHASGLQDTQWVTNVVLHNPGSEQADVLLWFLKAGRDNSDVLSTQAMALPESSTLIEDIVLTVFGENEAAGAIVIGSNQRLVVTSRTYNDASSGTYGQFIPGRDVRTGVFENETVHLIQLTRSETYRSNLGVANPTPNSTRVQVSLRNADGDEIGSRNLVAHPYGYVQRTDVFGIDAEEAFAVVSSSTEDASFFPYASVVDNRTGDPMMIESLRPSDHLLIAASAHVGGFEDTDWRTDLELCNPQTTAATAHLSLLMSNADNSSPETIPLTVEAAACERLSDVLDNMFAFEGSAAIDILSPDAEVMVSSRTFNTTDTGTYGQFLPGVDQGATLHHGEEARIVQLAQSTSDSTGFRTNLGFVNRMPSDTVVETELYSSNGTYLGAVNTRLEPFEHRQINRIFRRVTSFAVTCGYAVVSTPTTDGAFVAYASVVDNASGDPVYIPAHRVATVEIDFELFTTGSGGSGGHYGIGDDLDGGCNSWSTGAASVADWNDLVLMWQAEGEAFADSSWIRSGRSYFVNNNGEPFRQGTDEHYLIARHEGDLPSDFVSYGAIGDHFIDLGSSDDSILQILCKRTR